MDSNTHSTQPPVPSEPLGPFGPLGGSVGLAGLPAVVGELAAEDLDQLADSALAEELLALRRWLDGLEGQWLRRLAAVDARGAAGADRGERAASTAGWLRNRLRLGAGAATESVRTAQGAVPWPPPPDRPGPDRRGDLPGPCSGAGPGHRPAPRPAGCRGRTGPAGGGRPPGSAPAAPGRGICARSPTPRLLTPPVS